MILLECNGCNRVMHLPDSEGEFLDRDEPLCPSCRAKDDYKCPICAGPVAFANPWCAKCDKTMKQRAGRKLQEQLDQFVEVPKDRGPVTTSLLIFVAGVIAVIIAMLSGCGETSYQVCMKNGYPKVDYVFGTAYCRRQVLGTDEVVPADKLRGQGGAK